MSLARRSARNFGAQGASFLISFVDRIALAGVMLRTWGIAGFSDWTTVWSAAGLLVLGELGFQTMLGNMLVKAEARRHQRSFQHLVELGLFFYAAFAVLVLTALVIVALTVDLGAYLRLSRTGLEPVVILLCLYQLLRIVRGGVLQVLRGKGEYHRMILADVVATGSSVAAAVMLLLLHASPVMLALCYVGVELVVGFGLNIVLLRRRHPLVSLRLAQPSRTRLFAAARELRWYTSWQFNSYVMLSLPVLIIAWLGLSGVGLAAFAVQRTLVNFARTLAATFSQAVGVELATIDRRIEADRLIDATFAIAKMNVALAALATVGIMTLGTDALVLWTGHTDLGSPLVLALLLAPVIWMAPVMPLMMLSLFAGQPKAQAIGTGVQMIIAIPLCVVLGHSFAVPGIAAALALGEIIGLGIVLPVLAGRGFTIPIGRLIRSAFFLFVVTASWATIIAFLTRYLLPGSTTFYRFIRCAAWASFSGMPTLLTILPAAQRKAWMKTALRPIYGLAR